MTSVPMLAKLLAQAEAQGADLVTLRALIEEASEAGAMPSIRRSMRSSPGRFAR